MLLKAKEYGHCPLPPKAGKKIQILKIPFCCSQPAMLQMPEPSSGKPLPPVCDAQGALGAAGLEPERLQPQLSSALLWARAGEAPPAPCKLLTWQPPHTCSPNSPHPPHCPGPPAASPVTIQKGSRLPSHSTSSFLLIWMSCCSLRNAICNAGAASFSSDQFSTPPSR